MFNVQYRRVNGIDEHSLDRMSGFSLQSRNSEDWDYWDIGEFTSIENAIDAIQPMYGIGPVVKMSHLGCVIYWFEEIPNHYIQIRFIYHRDRKPKESPWKIGLNDV